MIKDVSQTIKYEAKQQKGRFLGTLLGKLPASLFGSALAGQEVVRCGDGVIRAGEGVIRAGQDFLCCLIL